MFYNALCAVASFDLLNILNISFNINTVIWKKIVYYFVLFHDMLHYKDKPAKQWNSHLFYFLFNWLVIHIKKWVAIINKMLRQKGKCICLCWAYGWLHFKTFAIQYFFFLNLNRVVLTCMKKSYSRWPLWIFKESTSYAQKGKKGHFGVQNQCVKAKVQVILAATVF